MDDFFTSLRKASEQGYILESFCELEHPEIPGRYYRARVRHENYGRLYFGFANGTSPEGLLEAAIADFEAKKAEWKPLTRKLDDIAELLGLE